MKRCTISCLVVVMALGLTGCIKPQSFDIPTDISTDTADSSTPLDNLTGEDSAEVTDLIPGDQTDLLDTADLEVIPDDQVAEIDSEVTPDQKEELDEIEEICVANCVGKVCGDDGCGGICGDCSDGNACNGDEICNEGQCEDGPDKDCNDNKICTVDSCNETSGLCEHDSAALDGTDCNDNSKCTSDTVCMGGTCGFGINLDCNDHDVCTDDTCNPSLGCVNAPLSETPCNDGDYCTSNDKCNNGLCVGGATLPECLSACGNCSCEVGESFSECPVDCGYCGDGVCGCTEFVNGNCPQDCTPACGNGKCEGGTESATTCQVDCHGCGDEICGGGENHETCYTDCPPACGNQECEPGENGLPASETNPLGCPQDCLAGCGNGQCEGGENPDNCAPDCAICGDGICGILVETATLCPQDCLDPCGNGICAGGETPENCALDCGWCGDGTCGISENFGECPADCLPYCGNGACDHNETEASCPQDCGCIPLCDQKECGDDGCEGLCGVCNETEVCNVGTGLCE